MSTITELNPRLLALTDAGVSVWLDQIRRSMIESGELARMIAVESLRGETSNPAIFEKAILGSDDYDDDLRALARENLDSVAIYERIAIRDVQLVADVLLDVHRSSGGRDGFVSLEVAPELAHDTDGTLAQAVGELRTAIRAATGAATTFGYGPRYLHSTGQLHKGGPPVGRFLQLVSRPTRDAPIPGARYSFGGLMQAQAIGDLGTLKSHGLPAERVELEGDPAQAVRALSERITAILQET
jgi:Transaldolase/Fructose-6-phosphate aldolase